MILIGLIGHMGAGKTTVANHLREKYDFVVLSFADAVKEVAYKLEIETTRENLQNIGMALRGVDPDAWIRPVDRELGDWYQCSLLEWKHRYVISDVRFPNEAQYIVDQKHGLTQQVGYLIGLWCDVPTLHYRIVERKREGDMETMTKFLKLMEHPSERHIDELFKQCGVVIDASKDIDAMLRGVDAVVEELIERTRA